MHVPPLRVRRRARIEIIPLIDIIFFLLATFMMVSLSMIQNRALSVHLPVASSSTPQDQDQAISITITEDGNYAWNKEPVSLSELVDRLHQLKVMHPDPKVFIHGDGDAHFKAVVLVLDETRKAGITKVAIETAPMQP